MTWDPPWPPIRIAVDEWIIMRDRRAEPAGVIRRLLFNRQVVFRVVTWAPTSEDRKLVGYFPSLEVADRSIKFPPPTSRPAPAHRTAADHSQCTVERDGRRPLVFDR